MNNVGRKELMAIAAIVALGIAGAGYFVSQTLYNAKVALNTAEVKGLAERRVEADRAFWNIQYTVAATNKSDIPKLYEESAAHQKQVVALLRESGFDETEIEPGVIDYEQREFRDENQKLVEVKHQLTGSIEIQTNKVQLLVKVRSKMNELIFRGLDIKNNPPAYHFTKLNEIKPAMVQEATMNARIAANEFAANAGVKVGGIRDARQGNFVVTDVGADYSDTKKIEKDVRLVTNITFYLTD
jgi:hypothetical protein